MNLLNKLNNDQRQVVEHTEGALLVTAGAGSGKTRALTHRIAYLVKEKGISEQNILAITFTNKAAMEMKERLAAMLDIQNAKNEIWVSTFHSMCVVMLRRYADRIGLSSNFSIYTEKEKESVIKRIFKNKYPDTDIEPKHIIGAISNAKNKGLDPDGYKERFSYQENVYKIYLVFVAYEQEKTKSNALDFDDLLIYTRQLLAGCTEPREYYQHKFKYILVDEFQDTNGLQYEIIRTLAGYHKNIMMVGDEDQSIYSWRGASLKNLQAFINDFSPKQYKLEQNYRSTQNILDIANNLISNNSDRLAKNLWTDNPRGADITTHISKDENSEADFVLQKVLYLKRQHDLKNSDFAILMRVNALTRAFEEKCMSHGIPYRITGGFKFYDRKEIKDILAYLRIAANPKDNEAVLRVINFPSRKIGQTSIDQLTSYADDIFTSDTLHDIILSSDTSDLLPLELRRKLLPFAAVLKRIEEAKTKLDVAALTRFIISLLDLKAVFNDDTDENENRKQNISELVGSIEAFVKTNPGANVSEYLQTVSLFSDTDNLQSDDKLSITTIHSAKGLEFKCVFIVGLEDGFLPIAKSIDKELALQEERRLFYVAITRAEQLLFLSYATSRFLYGQRKYSSPSRFLKELNIKRSS